MSAPPIAPGVRRLLIVLPSWVGDAVMATPVLRAARAALPEARLVALGRAGICELLAGLPWIDEFVSEPTRGVLGPVRTAAAIRNCRPDAALLLPNSFRAAVNVWLARTPRRVGYARDGRGWMLTHALPRSRERPIALLDYYGKLASFALGIESIEARLELRLTEDDRRRADELLRDVPRPFLLLNPGGNRPAKRWPAARFARVADALASSHHLHPVGSGSPAEHALLDEVVRSAQHPMTNLASRGLTLGPLKAVIAQAALMITNDTGPRHIAAALGTPVVTLFGPTDHRWTTINCPHERLLLAEPFLPEDQVADDHPKECAIDRIAVSDVVRAAAELIPLSPRTRGATPIAEQGDWGRR